MLNFESPVVLHLAEGQLLPWRQRAPVRLRVLRGRVWVTKAGDVDDHFLDAGAQLRLLPGDRVLIGAEAPAQLAFAAEPGLLRRFVQRWSSSRARRPSMAPSSCPATGAVSSMT
jgi:Protein of unknown function (DUF2917)